MVTAANCTAMEWAVEELPIARTPRKLPGRPDQVTIPRQMFSGIRDSITPTIVALATILVLFSTSLLVLGEWLRRKSASPR